jgi:hypothetical protein
MNPRCQAGPVGPRAAGDPLLWDPGLGRFGYADRHPLECAYRVDWDAGFSYKVLHRAAAEQGEAWQEFRDWACGYVTADVVVTTDESGKNDHMIFRLWANRRRGLLRIRTLGSTGGSATASWPRLV